MCGCALRQGHARLWAAIGADVYITLEAPEDIPGFIDQRIAGIKAVYAH
jgi:hypothetical protein